MSTSIPFDFSRDFFVYAEVLECEICGVREARGGPARIVNYPDGILRCDRCANKAIFGTADFDIAELSPTQLAFVIDHTEILHRIEE